MPACHLKALQKFLQLAHLAKAVPDADAAADGADALLRQKLKGAQPDRKELKKASDALARRGFRWQDISAALRRYGAEIEDE